MSPIDRIIKERLQNAMAIVNVKMICDDIGIKDCEQ